MSFRFGGGTKIAHVICNRESFFACLPHCEPNLAHDHRALNSERGQRPKPACGVPMTQALLARVRVMLSHRYYPGEQFDLLSTEHDLAVVGGFRSKSKL